MLHVNDNSNDDLFRKAAEDYFLKAEKPDWDTLLHKINTGELPSAEKTPPKKKKYYPLLFLLNSSRSILRLLRLPGGTEKSKKKIEPAERDQPYDSGHTRLYVRGSFAGGHFRSPAYAGLEPLTVQLRIHW